MGPSAAHINTSKYCCSLLLGKLMMRLHPHCFRADSFVLLL